MRQLLSFNWTPSPAQLSLRPKLIKSILSPFSDFKFEVSNSYCQDSGIKDLANSQQHNLLSASQKISACASCPPWIMHCTDTFSSVGPEPSHECGQGVLRIPCNRSALELGVCYSSLWSCEDSKTLGMFCGRSPF